MDWTEEYRPQTVEDIVGNDGAIQDLLHWGDQWPSKEKAVILYGVPGVGKTTAAHALSNDLGWDVIEMNASESRTKDIINRVAGEASATGTLVGGESNRRLTILDEADSLHGNKDRGGSQAMTEVVKETEQPLILIANDFYEMSKTLRNRCKSIEFEEVDTTQIVSRLREIVNAEGVAAEDDALYTIASQNDGDVRAAINDLQSNVIATSGTLTEGDVTVDGRDRTEEIFPFLSSLFQEVSPAEARTLARNVDETPDDLVNWIEENIVKEYEGEELAAAYDQLSRSDEWLGRVLATQNYQYWRYASDHMSSGVAAARESSHGGWTRYSPPSYWRKLGQSKGTRKKRDYIAQQIAQQSHVSMATAREQIIPLLAVATHHCKNRELTVDMTAAYTLDAEHVSFITDSGEDTNKVQDIVADAEALKEKTALKMAELEEEDNSDQDTIGLEQFAQSPQGAESEGELSDPTATVSGNQQSLNAAFTQSSDQDMAGGKTAGDEISTAGADGTEGDEPSKAVKAEQDDDQSGLGDWV